jgi:hypothetical protein
MAKRSDDSGKNDLDPEQLLIGFLKQEGLLLLETDEEIEEWMADPANRVEPPAGFLDPLEIIRRAEEKKK